ncbi:bifunctional glucose-6-phosphate/mannose-6-phosphate isomerase [Sphaerisporangium rufum]|uniref:Bifunctional glucose-6-phosphate/mannose-6-phosphate isomerase n=1 Tax=Sphaerisporangium rufum TaxID=1381558 RepID=A0A919UZC0_9ACTN|nr:SIS domain-containing protein [Sphaerisporangium rufum]GII75403.1 bifunctional glucose-6-phosphate/mannose-6-phosphate isomerase [Sphaerisporangium rufum]
MRSFEGDRLDDPAFLAEGDPSGMLPGVASSAAQVRSAHRAAAEAGVARLAGEPRPRALVVAGMGTAALAGEMLAAVCGGGVPMPIASVASYRLPGWVGAADLVVAVSATGDTEETRVLALEAVRRGCRLVTVTRPGSPLAAVARQASGLVLPVVPPGGAASPAASPAGLWGVLMPLLAVAEALRLAEIGPVTEAVAGRLEDLAHRCRPSSESFINPGKSLALELAGSIPVVWGTSPVAAAAAHRLAAGLGVIAGYPALWGEIPAADHDQLATLDGPLAERDIFADGPSLALRVVLLRDLEEHPQVGKRRAMSARLAHDRGVAVSEIAAAGAHPLERLASLVGLADYAAVYLALGFNADPGAPGAVTELAARISQ